MTNAVILGILACVGSSGCAHTRDISSTSEYKPWIGKTVKLCDSRKYNVFAPSGGAYFISGVDGYNGYPILATAPDGYPVVIEAVKKTEGRYVIGGPFTHVWLVLSMEKPGETNKRIKVHSELNYVEPFRDKQGHVLHNFQDLPRAPANEPGNKPKE
jgi:hypothetical protein